MIELGLVLLLVSLVIGFSKMSQWDKFFRMGFLMLLAAILIIGNYFFIPTTIRTESYLATEMHDPKHSNIEFEKLMIIVKIIHDRPLTYIGDKVEYVIGPYDLTPKEKPSSKKDVNKEHKRKNIIEMGV